MDNVLFSRESDNWATPDFIYNYFVGVRGFFDPCPFSLVPEFDGLSIDWEKNNFVNPPYSSICKWVEKSIFEIRKGNNVVLLIPSRTDTKYFRALFDIGCDFFFFTGRLRFSGARSPAPFPSVLVFITCKTSTISFIDSSLCDLSCLGSH